MNIDQLENFLDEDLAWRKKEISELTLFVESNKSSITLQKTLVLMIYAHWEGFIKKGCKYYLKFVSESKTKLSELNQNFLAIIVKKKALDCLEVIESNSLSVELALLQDIEKKKQMRFRIGIDPEKDLESDIVDTKHNLSSKRFSRLLTLVGLELKESIKNKSNNYIDKKLLATRNAIGHGGKSDDIYYRDVMKLKDIILAILDDFKEEIVLFAENKYYLSIKTDDLSCFTANRDILMEKIFTEIDEKYI